MFASDWKFHTHGRHDIAEFFPTARVLIMGSRLHGIIHYHCEQGQFRVSAVLHPAESGWRRQVCTIGEFLTIVSPQQYTMSAYLPRYHKRGIGFDGIGRLRKYVDQLVNNLPLIMDALAGFTRILNALSSLLWSNDKSSSTLSLLSALGACNCRLPPHLQLVRLFLVPVPCPRRHEPFSEALLNLEL